MTMKTVRKVENRIQELINLHLDRPNPRSVSINLTNKCDQRCVYCEIGRGLVKTQKQLLTVSEVRWIVDEMASAGIYHLYAGGGEPLLFRGIFDIVRHAHEHRVAVSIVTNGMLIPRLAEENLEVLRECQTDVMISIDSFSEQNQGRIRGIASALPLQIEAVKRLVGHGILVNIGAVVSKYNYDELLDLSRDVRALGVRRLAFQPVIFNSNFPETEAIREKKELNIRPEHLDLILGQFEEILEFENEAGISTNVALLSCWLPEFISSVWRKEKAHFEKVLGRLHCHVLYSDIAVNYYGDVLPCNMLPPRTSIRKRNEMTLVELWNEACGPARAALKRGKFEQCRSCVCMFETNLRASMLRYPLANRAVIQEYVRMSMKGRGGIRGFVDELLEILS